MRGPKPCFLLFCLSAADTGRRLGYVMDNSNIYTARDAWLSDATAAEAAYGHISTWETGGGDGHVVFVLCAFMVESLRLQHGRCVL